jgi:hypothetical protein
MKTILGTILVLGLLPSVALADDDEGEEKAGGKEGARVLQPAVVDATWATECGACHIAFAPGLLPAESWRKIMSGLDKHFDTDATLTAAESASISSFLVDNASNRWSGAATPLRITETSGFKDAHDAEEVPAAVFKRESIKSAANCKACHPAADKAQFDEDAVKIPL